MSTARTILKWAAKILGSAAGIVIGVAVIVALLLTLTPVRNFLLARAIGMANRALPGEVSVERAAWPELSGIDLRGVRWSNETDSLVIAERVAVNVSLTSLLRRDIVAHSVAVDAQVVDVEAIVSAFYANSSAAAPAPTGERVMAGEDVPARANDERFPRAGALPGVPSVRADAVDVTVDALRLPGGVAIDSIGVAGSCDMSAGATPVVAVERLRATDAAGEWAVRDLSLGVDFHSGVVEGHGRVRVGAGDELTVAIATHADDAFTLSVSRAASEAPPRVQLEGRLQRDGLDVRRVELQGTIETPGVAELRRYPYLAGSLAEVPDVGGVQVAIDGNVNIAPTFGAQGTVDVSPNAWLRGAHVAFQYDEVGMSIRDLRIAFEDLDVDATLMSRADTLVVTSNVDLRGTRWAERLFPQVGIPQGVRADVAVEVERRGRVTTVALRGHGKFDDIAFDDVDAHARLSGDRSSPIDVQLTTFISGVHVGVAGRLTTGDTLRALLRPIVVSTEPFTAVPKSFPGILRVERDPRRIVAEGVTVTGDLAEVELDARLDETMTGPFHVRCEWPRVPALLQAYADSAVRDTIAHRWQNDGPFFLEVTGSTDGTASMRVRGDARFSLPGPRHAVAILPETIDVGDLGAVRGTADFEVDTGTNGEMRIAADLGATAWLDSSRIDLRKIGERIEVLEARLAMSGFGVSGAGSIDAESYDVTAEVHLTDPRFIKRFRADLPDVRGDATATIAGNRERPIIEADFTVAIIDAAYRVPELTGRLRHDPRESTFLVEANRGITTKYFDLDNMTLEYTAPETNRARVTLAASGKDVAVYNSAFIERGDRIDVHVDTLGVRLRGRDLRTTKPFSLAVTPAWSVELHELDMQGSIGSVRVDGFAGIDSVHASADIAVEAGKRPSAIRIPDRLWPERASVQVDVKGNDRIRARASVEGFVVGDGRRPRLELGVDARNDSLRASLSVADTIGSLIDGNISAPAELNLAQAELRFLDGTMFADLSIDRWPLRLTSLAKRTELPESEFARVSGSLHIDGPTQAPGGDAHLRMSFPAWPKLAAYEVVVDAALVNGAAPDSNVTRSTVKAPVERRSGLEGKARLLRGTETVLAADLAYPLKVSLRDSRAEVVPDGRMRFSVKADSLPFSEFDPLLPTDVGLEGVLGVDMVAEGKVGNPELKGRFVTRRFVVTVADRVRVRSRADITVTGTADAPVIRGTVDVPEGVIQTPDLPRGLHPTEGDAMLVKSLAKKDTVAVDSALVNRPIGPPGTDMDVKVTIPGRFWVRGNGLDLELSGELRIIIEQGIPQAKGQLRAVRGTLTLLGRRLELRHGTAVFGGGDFNPSLEVEMSTQIGAYRVRVQVGGTAEKPRLTLSSDPELREGDIMAVLLFGKPYNDLSDDQTDFLQERTNELMWALGAAQLQEISTQYGVDVVSYESDAGVDRKGSLTFGKYLNPQVLLSYVYSLDESSDSFVLLEYFLRGRFKIESAYGRRNQSAVGLGWSKDY